MECHARRLLTDQNLAPPTTTEGVRDPHVMHEDRLNDNGTIDPCILIFLHARETAIADCLLLHGQDESNVMFK